MRLLNLLNLLDLLNLVNLLRWHIVLLSLHSLLLYWNARRSLLMDLCMLRLRMDQTLRLIVLMLGLLMLRLRLLTVML